MLFAIRMQSSRRWSPSRLYLPHEYISNDPGDSPAVPRASGRAPPRANRQNVETRESSPRFVHRSLYPPLSFQKNSGKHPNILRFLSIHNEWSQTGSVKSHRFLAASYSPPLAMRYCRKRHTSALESMPLSFPAKILFRQRINAGLNQRDVLF